MIQPEQPQEEQLEPDELVIEDYLLPAWMFEQVSIQELAQKKNLPRPDSVSSDGDTNWHGENF